MYSVLGVGVFNSDGDMWKFHRSMTRPFFSRDRITHFEVFARHADDAISRMKARLREGLPIDMQDVYARFTLDSATEFLFGRCVHSLRAGLPYPYNHPATAVSDSSDEERYKDANAFAEAFLRMQVQLWQRAVLRRVWPLWEVFKDKTADDLKTVRAFLDPLVEEAVKKNQERKGHLDGREEEKKDEIRDDETFLEHLVRITDGKPFGSCINLVRS